MPVAIWPIAYIDRFGVDGVRRRSVEDQAPAGSPREAHLGATEREVISSSFAWPRCYLESGTSS